MTDLHPDLSHPGLPPLEVPARALAVGAHPDDIEFGAGATLAGWTEGGCRVTMVVVTDGSKGSWEPDVDPVELASRRRLEQNAAAGEIGAEAVVFLDQVDGEAENTGALRRRICRLIRSARPDVVLSHDPWQRYQLHPDHRAVGMAVVDAVVAARDHLFFPEQITDGLAAHRPGTLLLWSADEPNHWEEVGATLHRKVEALLRHTSQGPTTMGDPHAGDRERREFADRVTARAAETGAAVGMAAAEAFRRITP